MSSSSSGSAASNSNSSVIVSSGSEGVAYSGGSAVGAGPPSSSASTSASNQQTVSFEAPSHSLMCNDHEGDPWKVNITLMYTQDSSSPFSQPSPSHFRGGAEVVQKSVATGASKGGNPVVKLKNEKSLRELLEEQDVGKGSAHAAQKNFFER